VLQCPSTKCKIPLHKRTSSYGKLLAFREKEIFGKLTSSAILKFKKVKAVQYRMDL